MAIQKKAKKVVAKSIATKPKIIDVLVSDILDKEKLKTLKDEGRFWESVSNTELPFMLSIVNKYDKWITGKCNPKFIYSNKPVRSHGQMQIVKAVIKRGMDACLMNEKFDFFVFIIYRPIWDNLSALQKEAALHQALCSCAEAGKDDHIVVEQPDLIGYSANIEKFGVWDTNLKTSLERADLLPFKEDDDVNIDA
jgi:hypothetical protein